MSRISRKKIGVQSDKKNLPKIYRVGIYARLSVRGEEKKEESLDTQVAICKEFIKRNSNMVWEATYIDLGKSGMNFRRSGFERMMKEAKEGKINCIMAKDLSRIGRNHLEIGFYLEKYLPELHIRIIAINDDYDSFKQKELGENCSLKNLINEMYVRDISKKVTSVKKQKWENGEYTGGIPPYGYRIIKKEEGRKLELEEETARIVKSIYDWYLEGKSIKEIMEELHQKKILPPRTWQKTGQIRGKDISNVGCWSVAGIKHILTNWVYLGCMVKTKEKEKIDGICSEEELKKYKDFIQENTHSAIVSKEEFFETAKRIRRK